MECSKGPKTAAKEGRTFFAHVCLQERSRTCLQEHHLSVLIYGGCKFVSVISEIHLLGDPFVRGYGSDLARSSWPHPAGERRERKCCQFCQMVVATSNTNVRILDRTDWLIQQFQPEPLHPWRRTETKSFLFQIYNLAAWELLQKMAYDRYNLNNHGNPEKVVQIKGRTVVAYLSTPLNGAGRTCVKLFGGEAKRQPLLASSESTASAYENCLRERLGETGRKTWYSQNMGFLYTEPLPQRSLCTEQFVHKDFVMQKNWHRETCTDRLRKKTSTDRNSCTQKLYPEQLLQSKICFRTEVLRTEGLTHNIFYIQTLLYTDAFTLKTNCTQKLVHTAHFYTQPAFTQRGFAPPSWSPAFPVPPLKCIFPCRMLWPNEISRWLKYWWYILWQ